MNLDYSLIPTGVKENIILNKNPNSSYLTMGISTQNLTAKFTNDGTPIFFDQNGKYEFGFDKPFMRDAKGNVNYNVRFYLVPKNVKNAGANAILADAFGESKVGSVMTKKLFGNLYSLPSPINDYTLALQIDQAWLSDPKRVYPINIDPTVTHNTSSQFATGQLNRITDTGTAMTGATGGTITTSGGYTIHTFTSSGTFSPNGVGNVEVLAVGAGGAGGVTSVGQGGGGGGGAGGLVHDSSFAVTSTIYPVTIGQPVTNSNGGNTTFSTITALGGGSGGTYTSNGSSGGSGGGAGGTGSTLFTGGVGTQGNAGGNDATTGTHAAGGGGAGAVGQNDQGAAGGGAGGSGTSLYSSLLSAAGVGQNISGTYWIAGGGSGGYGTYAGGNGGGGRGPQGVGTCTNGTARTRRRRRRWLL